jgi:hypothetical protein
MDLIFNNSIMKNLLIIFFLVAATQFVHGQQKNRFRMGMDMGLALPNGGGLGALVNLEPKINIADHINVGIRLGIAGLAKEVIYLNNLESFEGEVSANASVLGTIDYYFNKGNSKLAPFLGAGFGYYGISNINIKLDNTIGGEEIWQLGVNFKWAPMVRAGMELGKFRLTVDYNLVPTTDLYDLTGKIIGKSTNQYIGLTAGFYIGGGKWKTNYFSNN